MTTLRYKLDNGVIVTLRCAGPDDFAPYTLAHENPSYVNLEENNRAMTQVRMDMQTMPGLNNFIISHHEVSPRYLAGLMNTFEFGRKYHPQIMEGVEMLEKIKATPHPETLRTVTTVDDKKD